MNTENILPPVATWRINAMRLLFLLIAVIMGIPVWSQILFESADWPVTLQVEQSLLAALALLSLLGVRYPLHMLPLMIFEITWKTIWLLSIAFPAWSSGRWNADMEVLFFECIGIVIAYFIVPWRYIWKRYCVQPMEPLWRKAKD